MSVVYSTTMGTLFIVATPIGNLEDVSIRAARILFTSTLLLCEDTRQTGMLLDLIGKRFPFLVPEHYIRPKLFRYDDQAERTMTPEMIGRLLDGESVALVSDAGTPLISDPGYVLVSEARKRGIPVVSVPGASALLAALTSSGFPADTFTFLGYPPEKQGHRLKLFTNVLSMHRCIDSTYVFYCAPHKLQAVLSDMKTVFGDCRVCLCRELTKVHEECWNGSVTEALAHVSDPKGEFVILVDLRV